LVEQTENIYCAPGDIANAVIGESNGILGSAVETVRFEESGIEGVKTAIAQVGSQTIKAAVVTNLKTAIPYLDAIKGGKSEFTFLELLACPMGCASGGGQPKVLLPQAKNGVYEKRAALSSQANQKNLGSIAQLPAVQRIYKEFFAKSCGDKSNRALHTEYFERKLSQ
jgi:iron only hydrogenase large subunit-like protein